MNDRPDSSEERALLQRLEPAGISSWGDVLLYLPKGYLDMSRIATLHEARPKEDVISVEHLFALRVAEQPSFEISPTPRIVASASDGVHAVRLIAYLERRRDADAWKQLKVGAEIRVLGRLQSWAGKLQITSPTLVPAHLVGKVIPQYPARHPSVPSRFVFAAVQHALEAHLDANLDSIFKGLSAQPDALQAVTDASSVRDLLLAVHSPASVNTGMSALGHAGRIFSNCIFSV